MMMMMMRNPVANPPVILPVMKDLNTGGWRRRYEDESRSGRRGQDSVGNGLPGPTLTIRLPCVQRVDRLLHRRTIDLVRRRLQMSVNLVPAGSPEGRRRRDSDAARTRTDRIRLRVDKPPDLIDVNAWASPKAPAGIADVQIHRTRTPGRSIPTG